MCGYVCACLCMYDHVCVSCLCMYCMSVLFICVGGVWGGCVPVFCLYVCANVLCVLCMLCVYMYGLFLCTGIYFSFSPSLCLLTVLEALTLDLIFPSVCFFP